MKKISKKIKVSSNKSFGIVFAIFFTIINAYFYYKNSEVNNILLILSLLFLFLGLIDSKLLTPLNILWFKFGILLSIVISPIVMLFIFFFVVTPIAMLAKLVKKDFLGLDNKKNKLKKSYWIDKENYQNSMKDQF